MAGELRILSRRAGDVFAAARFREALAAIEAYRSANAGAVRFLYGDERRRSPARRVALYVVCTVHGHARRSVARAAGLSAEAVAKACREIEAMRDDAAFDRMLDEIELFLMGEQEAEAA
jgi:hypothetical protein